MIITIDGPVASGKSAVARELAKQLELYYLYTGFLYRGLAYVLADRYGYSAADMHDPREADIQDIVHNHQFEYRYHDGEPKIFFDGVDITSHLKTSEMDEASSTISAFSFVRNAILEYQVEIGRRYDLVAEGRDMGTVVFPDAQHKFFLTASPEVRARRWQRDQERFGKNFTFQESLDHINERDRRDRERDISPLVQTGDMIVIDNSEMDFQQTLDTIQAYVTQ